jgi:hypothetical protein
MGVDRGRPPSLICELVVFSLSGHRAPHDLWRMTMRKDGEEIHVSTEEASGGVQPHVVRYMLGFSLLLAILALSAIWITGATMS